MENGANNNQYANKTADHYRNANAYMHNDSYKGNDAYGKKSPYEENDNREENNGPGLCAFWFDMKIKMQELMSSDIGLQSEERVISTDTDPFKLWLAAKMTARSFLNMFIVPLFVVLSYIFYIKANELFSFLVILILVLYIMWTLYCPGHQTYTAGAYAIHHNTIALYKAWRIQFKMYQTITILGFLFGTMFIAGVSYYPDIYNFAIKHTQMGLNYIHYPVKIGKVNREIMQNAAMVITTINGVSVLGYFLFVSYLTEKAKIFRLEYKKKNIANRTNSILQQRKAILRGLA